MMAGGIIKLLTIYRIKMKKIISTSLLMGLVASALANSAELSERQKAIEYQNNWSREHFVKRGLPLPDGGIKIVPEAKMTGFAENKEERIRIKKEIASLGYMKMESERAQFLLNFERIAKRNYKNNSNDFSSISSDLKHSIGEIKMAYTFVGVPANNVDTLIGYSPYLNFIKGEGWMGAVEFFKNNQIGICAYSENNVRLGHGSIVIAKEDTRYDINGKTTTVEVMGRKESGFVYNVEWYTKDFFRQLECANSEYKSDYKEATIELAKSIDSAQ